MMTMTMSSRSATLGAKQLRCSTAAPSTAPLRACRAVRSAVRRTVQRVAAYKDEEDSGRGQLKTIVPQELQNKGVASYDEDATRVFGLPAFTRRREAFAGRLAMLGFVAAWIGEIYTGQGIIGQVHQWTGLSENTSLVLIAGLVGLNAIGGLWPYGPTFSEDNQQDVRKRPAGPVQEAMDPLTMPRQFLGISKEWGFTKLNEIFSGRVAMVGFALTVVAETFQHTGPISQIAGYLNQPVNYSVAAYGLAAWSAVAFILAYTVGNKGELYGGKDVY